MCVPGANGTSKCFGRPVKDALSNSLKGLTMEQNTERTQERSRDKSPAFARKLRASKLARIERREARNQDVFDILDSGV